MLVISVTDDLFDKIDIAGNEFIISKTLKQITTLKIIFCL